MFVMNISFIHGLNHFEHMANKIYFTCLYYQKFIIFVMHVKGFKIILNMAMGVSNVVITQALSP
jgi:hypothetical protein